MVPKSGLALALAFFAVPATAVSINKRITGGEEALEGEFGSIVSIQSSNHFCAGVLLDSTTVLTAAHCASLDSVDQENYLVKAGTVDVAASGVVSQFIKPSSDQSTRLLKAGEGAYSPNDIAIFKLITPINETNNIRYATLPKCGSDPTTNSTAIAVGWGEQRPHKSLPNSSSITKLAKVSMPIHPRQKCVSLDPGAGGRDTIICAGGDGKNICKFDSGGPLFDKENGELIGIASFVIKDEEGSYCNRAPGVFTRVASYLPWINENLGGSGGYPSPDYVWTRKANSVIARHCNRLFNDASTCEAAARGCLTEVKLDAPERELKECADRMQVCADQRDESKQDECIKNAKACIIDNDIWVGQVDELGECAKKHL